jgi:hypothetical protein
MVIKTTRIIRATRYIGTITPRAAKRLRHSRLRAAQPSLTCVTASPNVRLRDNRGSPGQKATSPPHREARPTAHRGAGQRRADVPSWWSSRTAQGAKMRCDWNEKTWRSVASRNATYERANVAR